MNNQKYIASLRERAEQADELLRQRDADTKTIAYLREDLKHARERAAKAELFVREHSGTIFQMENTIREFKHILAWGIQGNIRKNTPK